MAISTSLRNRIVGFTIVASTILIFLPVILSKDMIRRENPDALAINSQGAVLDADGNLTRQPLADNKAALNIGQEGELAFTAQPPVNSMEASEVASAANANGVEMLEFSRPDGQNAGTPGGNAAVGSAANSNQVEILTAGGNKNNAADNTQSQSKPTRPETKEPEILVANNKKPETKPAAKPAPAPAPGTRVIAGSKPSERYVVQVGVFSKRANADGVVEKIKKAGISVYAIAVTNNEGRELFRIYAGRSNNRNELNDLVPKIDKLCGTKSKVVPF